MFDFAGIQMVEFLFVKLHPYIYIFIQDFVLCSWICPDLALSLSLSLLIHSSKTQVPYNATWPVRLGCIFGLPSFKQA